MCPEAIVAQLLSGLSTLGPQATVSEAFNMARDVVERRDNKLKETEEKVKLMAIEVERLATSYPMLCVDTAGDTVAENGHSAQRRAVVCRDDSCDIPPLSLSTNILRNGTRAR
eukprot:3633454-Prymnesium_polylepis.1